MENFDYFDALKESLEQAVDYTKGDKSRCRTVVRETPIPAYKADDVARTRKAWRRCRNIFRPRLLASSPPAKKVAAST